MKIIDCTQGTTEWLRARLGIPTSSEFHKIITATKGDLSKSARKYAHQLVAETLLGEPLADAIGSLEWVARGKLLEPQAVQQYEFTTDVETRSVGFVTTDCGRLGCSPDRLVVGERGAVEIKCPAPQTHMGFLLDGPGDDYRQQVQGQLAIAELEWVDFYAFHPALPPVLIRTCRDEPYIAKMRAALTEFLDMRDEMLATARRSGFFGVRDAGAGGSNPLTPTNLINRLGKKDAVLGCTFVHGRARTTAADHPHPTAPARPAFSAAPAAATPRSSAPPGAP